MNLLADSARQLVEGIKAEGLDAIGGVDKLLCPPFVYLPLVLEAVESVNQRLSA